MRRLLMAAAVALASPGASAGCWGQPPSPHGDPGRDGQGLAWYSQPVCHRVEFAAGALALAADVREALAQRLEGAARLYATGCLTVAHGPERADLEEGRVAYLRWWLGLRGIRLDDRTDRWEPEPSGNVIELQIQACDRR